MMKAVLIYRVPAGALALAGVLSGLVPGSAGAQTVLTVSGTVRLALAQYEGGDGVQAVRSSRLDSSGSRLVISGAEQLEGGSRLLFSMGHIVRADTGEGQMCGRDCWVGLTGPWGALKMGRLLAVYDDVSLPWYFLSAEGNHNPKALWANCGRGAALAKGCFDDYVDGLRFDAALTPQWHASVTVARPPPASVADPAPAVLSYGAVYQAGPWYLGLARQDQREVRGAGQRDHASTLSLSRKGGVDLGLGYEHLRYDNAGGSLARDYIGVMLSRIEGRHAVWLNYGVASAGHGSGPAGMQVNAVRLAPHSGAAMRTLGYQYRWSRRFQIYAFLNTIDNEANASYGFDTGLAAQLGTGQKLRGLVLGMAQQF